MKVTIVAQVGAGLAQHAADVEADDVDAAISKSLRGGFGTVTTLCGKYGPARQGREFNPDANYSCGTCRRKFVARTQPSA